MVVQMVVVTLMTAIMVIEIGAHGSPVHFCISNKIYESNFAELTRMD